jgi:hypothetical protein
LYPKDHQDYGLIKRYELLTPEEKKLYDAYFGDGGRNVFMYILNPIFFLINIIIAIVLFYMIDLLIFVVKFFRRQRKEKI